MTSRTSDVSANGPKPETLIIEINVCVGDDHAGECDDHRALTQERVRGLLRFQHIDAALSSVARDLVNRKLRAPGYFTARDQGRLDGVTEARKALWESRTTTETARERKMKTTSETRSEKVLRSALEAIANAEIPGVSGGPHGASLQVMEFAQQALKAARPTRIESREPRHEIGYADDEIVTVIARGLEPTLDDLDDEGRDYTYANACHVLAELRAQGFEVCT